MAWNVNGWTDTNQILRQIVIHHFNPDILFITETYLEKDENIKITSYTYISHHRTIKAPTLHGGVGLLVNDLIYNKFNIIVIDKNLDGILVVKFVDNNTQDFIIFTCYLAPYDSPYRRNQSDFLGHLISQLYLHNYCSQIYICGYFNGRIGNLSDVVEGIDSLPNRNVLDKTVHGHGEALIGFMQDAKLCSLNGRLSPENNNFTYISPKGLSIVDYIIVPHNVFHKLCNILNVYTMTEIPDMCNLAPLIGNRCKLPDHSPLHINFTLTNYHLILITLSNYQANLHENLDDDNSNEYKSRRYYFNNAPEFYYVQ